MFLIACICCFDLMTPILLDTPFGQLFAIIMIFHYECALSECADVLLSQDNFAESGTL